MGVKASPSLVLAHAGTHPPSATHMSSLRCSRREPAPVKTGAESITHSPQTTCHSPAQRSRGILLPHMSSPPSTRASRAPPSVAPALVKTGAGIHHSFSPDHMSFRAQRSGVEESCCPSPHCPRGCGDPPSLRCSRREPAPVKTGAGTHHSFSPDHMSFRAQRSGVEESCCPSQRAPSLCLADAGTHPSLRCSRREPAPVKTGAGTHPFPRQSFPRRAFPRSASGIIWADPAKTHRRFVPCATTL